MELKATNHSYYCSESNFYVGNYHGENFGRSEYDTFDEFCDDWLEEDDSIDRDYNLCFRYDIKNKYNEEEDKEYELWLFFILQRKGIYRPVWIKNLAQGDMDRLERFLKLQWEYMKGQWCELKQ